MFDNYDTPKVLGNTGRSVVYIQQFLPEAHHGSVVVTTRSSKVNLGRRLQVGKIKDVHDSLQFLSNASRRRGVMGGQSNSLEWKATLTFLGFCCN